jgi:acyl-CoA hydrolase
MLHGLATDEKMRRCVDGYMTFVALDEQGQLSDVPQFVPETPVEVARFREGQLRREFRRKLELGTVSTMEPLKDVPTSDQPLLVRELLKRLPFRMPWDRDLRPQGRHSSYMHTIEPVREQHLNFHGTLYGGTLMRWMENTAGLSARAYAGSAVRLVGLHGLNFIRPVHRNVFVHIRSVVVHTSDADLTVLVNVHAENPIDGSYDETLRAFVTYVPVGDATSPRIPPLERQSEEDRALFEEVEHRLALQRSAT